jgi:predicted transcriptional regulator
LEKNNPITFNSNGALTSNSASWSNLGSLTFPTPSFYTSLFYNQASLQDVTKDSTITLTSNSTRMEVYNFVAANPGIQFRGICTGLGIAIGTAEFHLGVLKRAGLVSFVRDGKYKRFFVSKKYSIKEMKLISLLRHDNTRKIIKKIVSEEIVPHKKLATYLSITSQGLTWHMNQLRKEGIIEESIDGIKVAYSLNEDYVQLLPELICVIERC